ncbi:MAG: hypothetical protein WBV46_03195 [Terriglobales bacterium]
MKKIGAGSMVRSIEETSSAGSYLVAACWALARAQKARPLATVIVTKMHRATCMCCPPVDEQINLLAERWNDLESVSAAAAVRQKSHADRFNGPHYGQTSAFPFMQDFRIALFQHPRLDFNN